MNAMTRAGKHAGPRSGAGLPALPTAPDGTWFVLGMLILATVVVIIVA